MKPGPKYRCPECGKILQSKHRHDFVECECPNKAFVDGGSDYVRVGYMKYPPIPVPIPKALEDV